MLLTKRQLHLVCRAHARHAQGSMAQYHTVGCLTLQGPLSAGPKEMLSISPSCVRACTRAAALLVPLPDASKAAAAI